MLSRELRKMVRAPLTWAVAALAALLTGHGFVLAIDIFTAGARSVRAGTLLAQQFDPLAGIVRPTLGGAYFAISLLGPLIACRCIAIEKERHTWHSLLLMRGSALVVVASSALAALVATLLPLGALTLLWLGWLLAGGHLSPAETAVAFGGHLLYGAWLSMLAVAVSSWAKSWAQSAATVLVAIMASWALDSSSAFAPLAWLGQLERLSASVQLVPFERGVFALGPALYFLLSATGFFGSAWAGAQLGRPRFQRVALAVALAAAGSLAAAAATHSAVAVDLTEGARLSFPRAVAEEVRSLHGPVVIEIELDRDDARRGELERDFLFKLRLARPDVELRFPLDVVSAESARDDDYGKVRLTVAGSTRESYSSGAGELATVLLEAAGKTASSGGGEDYPGWPLVVEGARRSALVLLAYFLVPGALAAVAALSFRNQRRRT